MYIKHDYKDMDGKTVIGKAIEKKVLLKLLKNFPEDIMINCHGMTCNLMILDKDEYDIGYIDLGNDEAHVYVYGKKGREEDNVCI